MSNKGIPMYNSMADILKTVKDMLRDHYKIAPARKGYHRNYPLALDGTWTFEQDFVWTTLTKYPRCADIVNTDNPEIQLNIGKEEMQNDLIDIEFIQDATHPLILPHPMYLKKGTVANFSNVNITTPNDVKILFGGFHPIKETNYNPVLFGKPYFKVARFTGVTAGTPVAPYVISLEDWEEFTITDVVTVVRKNDTDTGRLLLSDDSFMMQVEVSGKELFWREIQNYNWAGDCRHPRHLDPPIEKLSGTQILVHIYPPSWWDSYVRKVYVLFYGIMKYKLEYLGQRFSGTVNKQ